MGTDIVHPNGEIPIPSVTLNNISVVYNTASQQLVHFEKHKTTGYILTTTPYADNFVLNISPESINDAITVKIGDTVLTRRPDGSYLVPMLESMVFSALLTIDISRYINATDRVTGSYNILIERYDIASEIFNGADNIIDKINKRAALVIGNPNHNPPEARVISNLVSELGKLMNGTTIKRGYWKIDDKGNMTKALEDYIKYDVNTIMGILSQLDEAIENYNALTQYIRIESRMFNYNGVPELVILDPEYDARYLFEATGASGGHETNTSKVYSSLGGRGGIVKTSYDIPKGNVFTVRVGGQGEGTAHYDIDTGNYTLIEKNYIKTKAGGWPNGGNGGAGTNTSSLSVNNNNYYNFGEKTWAPGTGGGGSTDIILGDHISASPVDLANLFTYNDDDIRYVVAAGGGGCAQRPDWPWPLAAGGDADQDSEGFNSQNHPKAGSAPTDTGVSGRPGTGDSGDGEGNGGGGGGFNGGGANSNPVDSSGVEKPYENGHYKVFMSGAGGSNHYRQALSFDAQVSASNVYGNGHAKVTWLFDN
ncbi:MAG: hypothetical protein LBC77_07385 [Spirochaetaceae bacterium]|nr:hypothetical protein [Spirochaetaceae bacterium]